MATILRSRRATPPDAEAEPRTTVLEELAGLRADVKALRRERDDLAEVNRLRDSVEQLKREKSRR